MGRDVIEKVKDIYQAIADRKATLTTWEEGFMTNVQKMIGWNTPLSPKQDAVLESIWKKAKGHD